MDKFKGYLKKLNEIENIYILIFVAIFILSDFFRRFFISIFIKSDIETIYNVNYILIILMGILIWKFYKRIDKKYSYLICTLIAVEIIQMILNEREAKDFILDMIFIIMPLMLLTIKLMEKEAKKIIANCIKILNIFTITILVIGIVDYVTNRGVQYLLNDIGYFNKSYSEMIQKIQTGELRESYRYISIFGHPLRNAQLFIGVYILNFIGNSKFYEIKKYIVYTVTLVLGCIISNGKTAIVIAIFLSIYTYFYKKRGIKLKQIVIGLIGGVCLVNTRVFKNTILIRFKEAIVNKDLTSGRNVIFQFIKNKEVEFPKLLGHGEGMSNHIIVATNQNIASLEYPFMIFFFDKGIIFTLVFYVILAIPLIKLIKTKEYNIAFMYLIFSGYVNIYNGIAINGDYLIQYIFINILIYNIAKFKIGKNNDSVYL